VSFRLELRPQVSADVSAAAAWYDEREPGLGAEFAFAVQQRLDELLHNPLLPRIRDQRRASGGFSRAAFLTASFIASPGKPFS